jgi:hypothetical protein
MNNTFKLGRSIAQLVPIHTPIKKERQEQRKEIITTVGNNNGNNSESKDCCFNVMDLRSNFVTTNLI